jgi:hypothetical protein
MILNQTYGKKKERVELEQKIKEYKEKHKLKEEEIGHLRREMEGLEKVNDDKMKGIQEKVRINNSCIIILG